MPDGSDAADLIASIEEVVRSGPAFVTLATGDGIVSVLITPHTRIVIHSESVGEADLGLPLGTIEDWEL